jgi:HSP20 family molecular chaperone IbpA
MRYRNRTNIAMAKLAHAEARFLQNPFLAPVVRGHGVRVKIAGVVCQMNVDPPSFTGWGIFVPRSHKVAMLDAPATMKQRRMYLELFPRVQMVVCHHENGITLAVPANRSDTRFQIDGRIHAAVELHLAEDVAMFDSVLARFDGSQFWFDQIDPSADPSLAAYLRQALVKMMSPNLLQRSGLSAMQREIYERLHRAETERRDEELRREPRRRMMQALAHGGAVLSDFTEHGDAYRVTFDLAGTRYVNLVRKDDLSVLSAGICLSGQDQRFDLASMVGVLREARQVGRFR